MSTELQTLGDRLVGAWTTEGAHPALPGEVITGASDAEWMAGEQFLVYRTRTDHPDFPDSLSVLGDTGGLQMHYFDTRGVYRLFTLTVTPGGWAISRNRSHDDDFDQRMAFGFDASADTMDCRCQISQDGVVWEDDYAVVFRRDS